MLSGIYTITNETNGKVYVGSAVNLTKRERQHRSNLNINKHPNRHLQASWNKRGEKAFKYGVLFYCAPSDLLWFEQRALDVLGEKLTLYNLSLTAGSIFGMRFGPEVRARVSLALKGRTYNLTVEQREARRRRMLGNNHGAGNKGPRGMKFPNRQLTDEHRDLLRQRATGRKHTEVTKRKISENLKRRRSCDSVC